jgi:hypothetical protein
MLQRPVVVVVRETNTRKVLFAMLRARSQRKLSRRAPSSSRREGKAKTMSTALRAAQKSRAQSLYRRSLKHCLSWAVNRELFWSEVRGEESGRFFRPPPSDGAPSKNARGHTPHTSPTHAHTPTHTGREDPGRVREAQRRALSGWRARSEKKTREHWRRLIEQPRRALPFTLLASLSIHSSIHSTPHRPTSSRRSACWTGARPSWPGGPTRTRTRSPTARAARCTRATRPSTPACTRSLISGGRRTEKEREKRGCVSRV